MCCSKVGTNVSVYLEGTCRMHMILTNGNFGAIDQQCDSIPNAMHKR